MKITLPEEVLKSLPAPASDDGLVRVTVGLKIGADGSANLVEVNDIPVPVTDDEAPAEEEAAAPEAPMSPEEQNKGMDDYSASASKQLSEL